MDAKCGTNIKCKGNLVPIWKSPAIYRVYNNTKKVSMMNSGVGWLRMVDVKYTTRHQVFRKKEKEVQLRSASQIFS